MKHYNSFCLLILCLLFSSGFSVSAQDAEYKKLSKEYILNEDGSQEYRYSMELTLFTHTAMNRTYGESFIVYNPLYQELKIHTSYTRQKDGTLVETPENAFVEVLPRKAANAPEYNHLKEMVVVHTGLELGATIYLDYSVISKPDYLPELDIFEELLQSSPVREYTISLSVPEDKPLFYTLNALKSTPVGQTQNGKKSVQWKLRNLPAASLAPEVSVANGDVPFLAASTWRSEEAALEWLYQQVNPRKDYWQFVGFADALTEGIEGEEKKMLAIHDYVTKQLAHSPLNLTETGYQMRTLTRVTGSAYGTEAEKANMLYTLLKVMNYNVELKAAYKAQAEEGSLGLSAIREFFVDVPSQNIALSPVHNRFPDALFYQELLPVRNLTLKGEKSTPADMKSSGAVNFTVTVVSLQEVTIRTEAEREIFYKEQPVNSKEPLNIENKTSLKQLSPEHTLLILPASPFDISRRGYQKYNSKRKERLTLPYPVNEVHTYRITLPANMELRAKDFSRKITNRAGELSFSVEEANGEFIIKRTLRIYTKTITPEIYGDFRALITTWSDENTRTLLLKM